jgi:YrbI family 3-deoxy-D-manno-octulosonate 8-phosphate phosphatase
VNCVAVIPARGGSKGIPRKNLCPLRGKPLLAYTIEHAKAAPSVDRVVVSTDDTEIADVANRFGAEVVRRPAEISGDDASSESAVLHALDELRKGDGYDPELVLLLQATSPIRDRTDVQRAIDQLIDERADSLFSACPLHGFVWRRQPGSVISLSYDYRARRPRQQSPEDFLENGSIYVTRTELLRATGNRLGGRIVVYPMLPLQSLQVDEAADLVAIERLLMSQTFEPPDVAGLVDIDLLVLDFDGVLTDDGVLVDQHGTESVRCHRGDGLGIARLRESGVEVVVLSTETNPVVTARCRKLRIEAIQACHDKLAALRELAGGRQLQARRVAYMGNDVNDLACLNWVGMPIAVADAPPEIRAVCRLVTTRSGGRGAVRQVADWILAARRTAVAGLSG